MYKTSSRVVSRTRARNELLEAWPNVKPNIFNVSCFQTLMEVSPGDALFQGQNATDPDLRDEDLARVEILTLLIILVITLIGNLMVLAALYSRRHYRKQIKMPRMYYFILHLSIADLLTGVFNVLPQLWWDINYRFPGSTSWSCKFVKFVQPSGSFLSSYILMAIAIDRYRAICHPLTYHAWNSRRSRIMIMAAWCTAFTFCIPQVRDLLYSPGKRPRLSSTVFGLFG